MVADIEIPEVDPKTNKLVDDEKHFFFQGLLSSYNFF
jgi:hypothetical protein